MIEDSVTTHKNNWILIKDSVYVLNIFIVCSEVDWENWDSAEFYDTVVSARPTGQSKRTGALSSAD